MQELLYSEYVEKNGLTAKDAFDRSATVISPGACLAVDREGQIIRFTHARRFHHEDMMGGTEARDDIDRQLLELTGEKAKVVARTDYPRIFANLDPAGKVTVLDETLWLKHLGDLPHEFTQQASGERKPSEVAVKIDSDNAETPPWAFAPGS